MTVRKKTVSAQQDTVVKQDISDPDDTFSSQLPVINERRTLVQGVPNGEMGIVIRHNARSAQSGIDFPSL